MSVAVAGGDALASRVDAALARLGPLAGERSLAAIRGVVPSLPSRFDAFGFECRLSERAGGVDLGVRVDGLSEPDWVAETLFLEYDTSSDATAPRTPSAFVRCRDARNDERARSRAERAASWLRGGALPPRESELLWRCFVALPQTGRVLDIGMMRGRGDARLRLHVSLPVDGVDAYLDALEVRVSRKALHELFERFGVDRWGGELDGVELQFELEPGGAARIGVEYGFPRHLEADRVAEWEAMSTRLVEAGLCTGEARRAVLGWSGRDTAQGLEYGLSHIKLVHRDDRPLGAKVYLYAEPLAQGWCRT